VLLSYSSRTNLQVLVLVREPQVLGRVLVLGPQVLVLVLDSITVVSLRSSVNESRDNSCNVNRKFILHTRFVQWIRDHSAGMSDALLEALGFALTDDSCGSKAFSRNYV